MLVAACAGCGLIVIAAVSVAAAVPSATTLYLALRIAIAFLTAVAAGYLCARLAPEGRLLATLALFAVFVLAASVISFRTFSQLSQPAGFLPAVTMLSVIGLWAGAMVERAAHGR